MLMEQWAIDSPASGRDYVPAEDLTWPDAECISSSPLVLSGRNMGNPCVRSMENLVAALSSNLSHIILQDNRAPITTDALNQASRTFLVWKSATSGSHVRCGKILIPDGCILMLLGSGAHFQHTTFSGGIVMCAGEHYSGTFRDCTFSSTAVYSVHGASPALHGCTITGVHPGLVASGRATSATLTNSDIIDCSTAISVECTASAVAHGCRIKRTDAAVVVTGGDGMAVIDSCYLQSREREGSGGVGVSVRRGVALIRSSVLTHFDTAFSAAQTGACIDARGVLLEECASAVAMHGGARVSVHESEMHCTGAAGRNGAAALRVTAGSGDGAAPCMQLDHSVVAAGDAGSVSLAYESSFAAHLTEMRCDSGTTPLVGISSRGTRAAFTACSAASPGTSLCAEMADGVQAGAGRDTVVRMHGGEYAGGPHACVLRGPLAARMRCVEFRGTSEQTRAVMSVADGARVWLSGCHVRDGAYGIESNGAVVRAFDTVVSDIRATFQVPSAAGSSDDGVKTSGGAGLVLGGDDEFHRGSVERCIVGLETVSSGMSPTTSKLHEVKFEKCLIAALVRENGDVTMFNCHLRGPLLRGSLKDAGYLLNDRIPHTSCQGVYAKGGTCMLECCVVSGYRKGVSVCQGAVATLEATDVELSDGGADATGVFAHGKVSLSECGFMGPRRSSWPQVHGIRAAGNAVVEAAVCSMDDVNGNCMHASHESVMAVNYGMFTGRCGQVFVVSKGGAMDIDGEVCVAGAQTAMKLTGGKITAFGVTAHVMEWAAEVVGSRGSRAELEMSTCKLRSEFGGVKAAGPEASMSITDSKIHEAHVGAAVVAGATVRLSDGVIYNCNHAVMVGDHYEDLQGHCEFCSGTFYDGVLCEVDHVRRRSDLHAMLSQRRGGEPQGTAPRCAHEGAVARAELRNVKLRTRKILQEDEACWGLGVHICGHLDAKNVTVDGYSVGYLMSYGAREYRSVFRNCRAVGCKVAGLQWDLHAKVNEDDPTPLTEILEDEA